MVTIDNPCYYRGDGVAVHTYFLSLNLAKLGCEVHVLGLSRNLKVKKVISNEGVIFHCFPDHPRVGKALRLLLFLRKTAKEILTLSKRKKFDVVHGQGSSTSAVAFAKALGLESKCVGTIHTVGFDEQMETAKDYWRYGFYLTGLYTILSAPPPIIMQYGKFVYNQMDVNISVSEYNRRRASLIYKIPIDKIITIPSAVNSSLLNDVSLKDAESRPSYPVILYVGRLAPRKGVHYLLQAMPHIIKHFPKVRLLVVGAGPLENYLKDLSRRLSLQNSVTFLGYVSDERIRKLLALADVVVVPSIFEGCPLVLLEAMATGKPVVASAVQGIPEVVKHDFSGLLVNPGNIREIEQTIIRLMKDKKFADYLGENARQTIIKDYSWEKIARRTQEVYEKS
jgi:glycosyltransferase involved in cell wall biosynthesis